MKVCQLSEDQLRHLVKMVREFSILFYKVRKNIFNHILMPVVFSLDATRVLRPQVAL